MDTPYCSLQSTLLVESHPEVVDVAAASRLSVP